ncbi:hypothetical protein GF312_00850 [Candidatus Poribacteria bacterium]|nr:hypothetical protein [Candidatus Poribacteria bacterium]
MIEYTLMGENNLLCYFLHGGKISKQELSSVYDELLPGEKEAGVLADTVASFLRAVCKAYDSCAILAVEDDFVVGKLRFYPTEPLDIMDGNLCVQTLDHLKYIANTNFKIPEKESLSKKSLRLYCFQIAEVYGSVSKGERSSYYKLGIGINMLKKLIDWARENDWDEISGMAIQHIPPLMSWSNHLSVERFRKLGFKIEPSDMRCDGAVSQRRGYHGPVIKELWKPYNHLSDDEVSKMYKVSLDLK